MSTPPGFNRTGYFACFVSVSIRSLAGDHDAILPEGPPGQPSDMGYRNATLSATACTPQLLRSYSGEGRQGDLCTKRPRTTSAPRSVTSSVSARDGDCTC
jgi:hypothetical protein